LSFYINDRKYRETKLNNMGKLKECFKNTTLEFIYQSKKFLTCRSLMQYHLYECYGGHVDFSREKEKIKKEKRRIEKRIDYLRRAGYVNVKDGKIELSKKGFFEAILYQSKKIKPKKVGKFFYVVVFDIPENMRKIRDLFRRVLYNFGSDRVQKSVFVIENEEGYKFVKDIIRESKISTLVKIYKCIK